MQLAKKFNKDPQLCRLWCEVGNEVCGVSSRCMPFLYTKQNGQVLKTMYPASLIWYHGRTHTILLPQLYCSLQHALVCHHAIACNLRASAWPFSGEPARYLTVAALNRRHCVLGGLIRGIVIELTMIARFCHRHLCIHPEKWSKKSKHATGRVRQQPDAWLQEFKIQLDVSLWSTLTSLTLT